MSGTRHLSLRVPADRLAEIEARARSAGLTRTEYMIRCALGEQLDPRSTEERVAALEARVARLDELSYGQQY